MTIKRQCNVKQEPDRTLGSKECNYLSKKLNA